MTNENETGSGGSSAQTTASSTSAVGWATSASANPRGLQQKLTQLLAGMQAAVPEGTTLLLRGQLLDKSEVEGRASQILAVFQALSAALTSVKTIRAQISGQTRSFNAQYQDLTDALVAFFGRDNPQLEQLGIAVSQPSKPLTPEQNVVRATKARKTRELRHTMGKRQKAKLQYTGSLEVSVAETTGAEAKASPEGSE